MSSGCEEYETAGPSRIVVKTEMETDEPGTLLDDDSQEKLYQCGACKEAYATPGELKEHVNKIRKNKMNTTHPPIPSRPFNCVKCEKSFPFISRLKQHMKPVECEVCLKRFSRKEHYNVHMRTHTGEKPFECLSCHRCFSDNSSLVRHKLTHSEENTFKCEICPDGKSFKTKGYFTKHMLIHNGVKRHECYKCAKKFLRKSDKTKHERIHLGIKPFECQYCKMRFTLVHHLTCHVRTHTGEKPYKCELCGRGFNRSTLAKRHMEKEQNKPKEQRCDYKHGE